MGVYLPNVDMPKGDKVLTVQICSDGSIWQQYRGTVPNAKAVPIPPHGRLIDADAIRTEIDEKKPGRSYEDAWTLTVIDAAPTIIPAEPSKEENK